MIDKMASNSAMLGFIQKTSNVQRQTSNAQLF